MREGDLTYDDFLQRLNIQDVLIDAGYHLNRRDGLRYPSYVRLDSEGRRIRGDKFIVTQQGKCCFQAQQQKVYNIISFIKAHPCNLQIFLCLFLEKLNMPQNTPVTKAS
ncbi:hypothetical protein GAIMETA21S03_38360 [Phocaeicola vulgatus]|nr:hypothetical protein GAIMETA21S03_38360 [Phocaeicola vulgatus]